MKILTFTVSLPTTNGFVGRKCPSETCGKYFKVREGTSGERISCAYCGVSGEKNSFATAAQEDHMHAQAVEQATEYASRELDDMLARTVKRFNRPGSFIKMDLKPARYRAKRVVPKYSDPEVDSELQCPECSLLFQVNGIFGFCPACKSENTLIYDANAEIILRELRTSDESPRALRHAYSDLVSEFESFCSKRAPASIKQTNFQSLFDTRKAFQKASGINILDGLNSEALLALRRVFLKRHANTHNKGLIGDRYVKMIPEDRALLGSKVVMSSEEFEAGVKSLRVVVDNIITK